MASLKQRLTTALLNAKITDASGKEIDLADVWGVDSTTVGKRMTDQLGIRFSDFCKALEAAGIQIITPDEKNVTISRRKFDALVTFASEGMDDLLHANGHTRDGDDQ